MPPQPVLYAVKATCADEPTRDRYLRWLVDRHVAMVLATGLPTQAWVLKLDEPNTVQTQYVFPSREHFDIYVRDHAPALRTEGLELFGSAATFSRSVGGIEASWPTLARS
jgi:hypothetical protein